MTIIHGLDMGQQSPEMDYQDWIDRVNDEGRNLTDWEIEFMISITDQFSRSGSLSEKQQQILERIYTERVP